MPGVVVEERVREGLERLRLREMAKVLDRVCAAGSRAGRSYVEVLDQLIEAEVTARDERTVEVKHRLAHLPFRKTMAAFDYGFQPSLDKQQIAELLTLRFVTHAENVLLLGPPGVGKTHIAVALASAAISHGATAYFLTMQQFVDYLAEGGEAVGAKLRLLLRPKVLVIDELGYVPLSREAASGFFELVGGNRDFHIGVDKV